MNKEAAYWIALAHLPKWGYARINSLIISFFHDHKIPIDEFFQLSEKDWKEHYKLDENQISDLRNAKMICLKRLSWPNHFLARVTKSYPSLLQNTLKLLKRT